MIIVGAKIPHIGHTPLESSSSHIDFISWKQISLSMIQQALQRRFFVCPVPVIVYLLDHSNASTYHTGQMTSKVSCSMISYSLILSLWLLMSGCIAQKFSLGCEAELEIAEFAMAFAGRSSRYYSQLLILDQPGLTVWYRLYTFIHD